MSRGVIKTPTERLLTQEQVANVFEYCRKTMHYDKNALVSLEKYATKHPDVRWLNPACDWTVRTTDVLTTYDNFC
jgi:hypothetical protein